MKRRQVTLAIFLLVGAVVIIAVATGFVFIWPGHSHINLDTGVEVTLPLRPIWPGFAVNTIFYAAILWLVIPGPIALRRHIRRKRGL